MSLTVGIIIVLLFSGIIIFSFGAGYFMACLRYEKKFKDLKNKMEGESDERNSNKHR